MVAGGGGGDGVASFRESDVVLANDGHGERHGDDSSGTQGDQSMMDQGEVTVIRGSDGILRESPAEAARRRKAGLARLSQDFGIDGVAAPLAPGARTGGPVDRDNSAFAASVAVLSLSGASLLADGTFPGDESDSGSHSSLQVGSGSVFSMPSVLVAAGGLSPAGQSMLSMSRRAAAREAGGIHGSTTSISEGTRVSSPVTGLLVRLAAFGRSCRARHHAVLALANLCVDRQHAVPRALQEGGIPAAAALLAATRGASHGITYSAIRLLIHLVEGGGTPARRAVAASGAVPFLQQIARDVDRESEEREEGRTQTGRECALQLLAGLDPDDVARAAELARRRGFAIDCASPGGPTGASQDTGGTSGVMIATQRLLHHRAMTPVSRSDTIHPSPLGPIGGKETGPRSSFAPITGLRSAGSMSTGGSMGMGPPAT